jgi:hypothetical protein
MELEGREEMHIARRHRARARLPRTKPACSPASGRGRGGAMVLRRPRERERGVRRGIRRECSGMAEQKGDSSFIRAERVHHGWGLGRARRRGKGSPLGVAGGV